MRLVDIQLSVPAILLAAVLGRGLLTIVVTITLTFWTLYARIARAETLGLGAHEFVLAAVASGAHSGRVLRQHILPNLLNSIVVVATLQLGQAILFESALTFLGLGLQPPANAWGLMIADGGLYLSTAWWVPTFPGLAIMVTVLVGANLLGDWLHDRLDPRLAGA